MKLADMKWPEVKAKAKELGISTGKKKRVAVESEIVDALLSQAPVPVKLQEDVIGYVNPEADAIRESVAADPPPDPNAARRDQLLQELAGLNGQSGAQVSYGLDYRSMTHGALKTMLVGRGIIEPSGLLDVMIATLQAEDQKRGLQPHPGPEITAPPPSTPLALPITLKRTNTTGSPINGAIHLVDAQQRKFASVYQIGAVSNGVPIILDMETHAQRIMDLYNG